MTSDEKDIISPTGEAPRGQWHIGTLTYTTAGLVVLFCWLLWGDFAWSMKDRSVGSVVQLLLLKYGISDFLAGLLKLPVKSEG